GPDNGLLTLAADELGITAAHEITNERYRLSSVSKTFHARDIFAPAAAYLAAGVAIGELGPAIDPETLVRVEVPEPAVGRTQISTTVLAVDRFGNVSTNAVPAHLESLGIEEGERVESRLSLDRYFSLFA